MNKTFKHNGEVIEYESEGMLMDTLGLLLGIIIHIGKFCYKLIMLIINQKPIRVVVTFVLSVLMVALALLTAVVGLLISISGGEILDIPANWLEAKLSSK